MRGEKKTFICKRRNSIGSSPHAWRKANKEATAHVMSRFISTCVEKSSSRSTIIPVIQVHLHMRGEKCMT